jgi:predicted nucleotidyltransferase
MFYNALRNSRVPSGEEGYQCLTRQDRNYMIDLEPYRNHINNLCRLLRVKELELFGSATRDDFSPASDIDVLVTFEGREQLFARYFDLKEGLEQIFGRRVDVVMPEAIANPIFREHVDKERTVVYGA